MAISMGTADNTGRQANRGVYWLIGVAIVIALGIYFAMRPHNYNNNGVSGSTTTNRGANTDTGLNNGAGTSDTGNTGTGGSSTNSDTRP
jgi:hypothetical protein